MPPVLKTVEVCCHETAGRDYIMSANIMKGSFCNNKICESVKRP